jgi:hypothetical protein
MQTNIRPINGETIPKIYKFIIRELKVVVYVDFLIFRELLCIRQMLLAI